MESVDYPKTALSQCPNRSAPVKNPGVKNAPKQPKFKPQWKMNRPNHERKNERFKPG